jgi:hypothetical protein
MKQPELEVTILYLIHHYLEMREGVQKYSQFICMLRVRLLI